MLCLFIWYPVTGCPIITNTKLRIETQWNLAYINSETQKTGKVCGTFQVQGEDPI